MNDDLIIRMQDVTKVYKSGAVELEALSGLNLSIAAGELIANIGASGSGKSTLMNLMGCLDVPSRGLYEFGGREVAKLNPEELADLRNRSIGFVFQAFHLLPHATARAGQRAAGHPGGRAHRQPRQPVRQGHPGAVPPAAPRGRDDHPDHP